MTENRWKMWINTHALATEMEASALFILATLRRCRGAAIFSVVGSVTNKKLVTDISGIETVINIGIEAMRKQIRKDQIDSLATGMRSNAVR
jgi:uridine phosphorylase